jgi:DNA (cytosine-5)-methyltransferase 1
LKPLVLDAYCCEGGMSAGFVRAGWQPSGVDLYPQPHYRHPFTQGDAIEYITKYGHLFDAIHASPPCQHDSDTQRLQGNDHPDLIGPTREALIATGKPYVIENVRGAEAKLRNPVMLCGAMFGIEQYRHRYFETNFFLPQPDHPRHVAKQTKMGRAPKPGEYVQCVGNFSGVATGRAQMEMPWASRDGLREAVPPAFAEYVGSYMLAAHTLRAAAA